VPFAIRIAEPAVERPDLRFTFTQQCSRIIYGIPSEYGTKTFYKYPRPRPWTFYPCIERQEKRTGATTSRPRTCRSRTRVIPLSRTVFRTRAFSRSLALSCALSLARSLPHSQCHLSPPPLSHTLLLPALSPPLSGQNSALRSNSTRRETALGMGTFSPGDTQRNYARPCMQLHPQRTIPSSNYAHSARMHCITARTFSPLAASCLYRFFESQALVFGRIQIP